MKKIVTIILSTILSMSALINPVSAELSTTIEEKGDFLYTYDGASVEAKYKKRNSKQEILRIEFPEKNNGKDVSKIGFTNFDDDIKAENLKVNTIYVPKYVRNVCIESVDYPELSDYIERFISLRKIEVDKNNPYLCSKDGVLYSKDMKIIHLYPNRNSMTMYKMPNSVEDYTGSPLLTQRNNLKKLYLSDNLKRIGYYFAAKCKNLEYVYIGENIKEIGEEAFVDNLKLKKVKINSDKLKLIDKQAFSACTSLKKINLPSSVKNIETSAFWGCKSLNSIKLPKNLKKIGEAAFTNCKSIKSITIPKGIKKIEKTTFAGCSSLKKVTILSNIKSIGYTAFSDCKKLSKVVIKNKNKAPKIAKIKGKPEPYSDESAFSNTKKGIKFYVKNKKVAKSLKKQLKDSGVRNAKILVGKKVVYKNVK